MLHFPSKDSSAHRAAPADVARLHLLLGDHVWAFSNCRVDAPGLPVAEVDWLFYNSVKGTFILSEWKWFPAPVVQVMDAGERWVLADGSLVPNPVEQVGRQLDAVRRVLRQNVRQEYFPSVEELSVNPYQSVYSPQVSATTRQERLRFGVVHGSLEELVGTVEKRYSPAPLVVTSDAAKAQLAGSLADHFRCSMSNAVRRKLSPPVPGAQPAHSRIAAIHRELAGLHLELARLLDHGSATAQETPAPGSTPMMGAPPPTKPPTAAPVAAPATLRKPPLPPAASPQKTSAVDGHLRRHVVQHVPLKAAGPDHVRAAFLAALQDAQLRKSGVHVGRFGALVGQRLEQDRKLSSLALGGLAKWCLVQAAAAGIAAGKDAADPSIVRVNG